MKDNFSFRDIMSPIIFVLALALLADIIGDFLNILGLNKPIRWIAVFFLIIIAIWTSKGGEKWIKRILDKMRKIAIVFGKQCKEKISSFICRTRHVLTKNPRYVFLTIFILCFTATAFIVAFIVLNNEPRQINISLPPTVESPTYNLSSQASPTTLPLDENEYCEIEPDECLSYAENVYEDEDSPYVYNVYEDDYQHYTSITLPQEPTTSETATPTPPEITTPPPTHEDYPTPAPILPPWFIPVTSITGIPSEAFIGEGLPLHGEAYPTDATNRQIYWRTWEIVSGAGASLDANVLNVTIPGVITIRATIVNGATPTTDFTQYFTINALVDERTFYAGDIDVINAIIANNGLSATLVDNRTPVATLPNDWDFVVWSDSSPRRVYIMTLDGRSFGGGGRYRYIRGHVDVSRLTQLIHLTIRGN